MKKIKFTCQRGFEREFNCGDVCEEPEFIPDFMVYNSEHGLLKDGFLSDCVNCDIGVKKSFLNFNDDGSLMQDEDESPVYGHVKTCAMHVEIWDENE